MGGGSSVLAASNNNTINALFNFAAAETTPSAVSAAISVNMPALIFSGSADCIVNPSVQQSIYSNIPYTCKAYVNITDALHCQFANNNGTCAFGQISSGCNSSSITAGIVFSKVMSVLKPFLDSYLKSACLSAEFINAYNNLTGVTATRTCNNEPACSPVAVSLLSFNAIAINNETKLTWVVTTNDWDRFEVQRSDDGINFQSVATVNAQPARTNYSFYDHTATATTYYRLKLYHPDGTISYSLTVRVIKEGFTAHTFPNPFVSELSIELWQDKSDMLSIPFFDYTGKKIFRKSFEVVPGRNIIPINGSKWPKGIYLMQILNGENKVVRNETVMKE